MTTVLPAPARAPRPSPRVGARATAAATVLALGVGAVTGLAGTGVHQVTLSVSGARWPLGVLVALALVGAVAGTVRSATGATAPTAAVAAGWLLVTGLATFGGVGTLSAPGGDVLVPDNGRGTAWVLGGAVVLTVVLVTGARRRRPGSRR